MEKKPEPVKNATLVESKHSDLTKTTKEQSAKPVAVNTTKTMLKKHASKPHSQDQLMVDKDIVIGANGAKTRIPEPMMTPHHLQEANHSSESLPVYTQKQWKPNEDAIPDLLFKENKTLAKIRQPKNATFLIVNNTKNSNDSLSQHENAT